MDLLDTDVLMDVQRGHPPALAWFASLAALPAVPGFVVMELVHSQSIGTMASSAPAPRSARLCRPHRNGVFDP